KLENCATQKKPYPTPHTPHPTPHPHDPMLSLPQTWARGELVLYLDCCRQNNHHIVSPRLLYFQAEDCLFDPMVE
ncbi:MAG TPA: hypothetical protein DEG17_23420, partial [Cyanobacteria bacterium UBA11149]|nr:hypothetical protein [Cyanobacteria bacterium UBA11153]HBW91732.1 hypothetical protein [Cyanobacteria bacterium UBA11149]